MWKLQQHEWKKIDPDNLPEGEVLAANFTEKTNHKDIGILTNTDVGVRVMMATEIGVHYIKATHYIDINQFDDERE